MRRGQKKIRRRWLTARRACVEHRRLQRCCLRALYDRKKKRKRKKKIRGALEWVLLRKFPKRVRRGRLGKIGKATENWKEAGGAPCNAWSGTRGARKREIDDPMRFSSTIDCLSLWTWATRDSKYRSFLAKWPNENVSAHLQLRHYLLSKFEPEQYLCVYVYSHSKRKHGVILFFLGASTIYLFWTEREREREREEDGYSSRRGSSVKFNPRPDRNDEIAKENKRRIKAYIASCTYRRILSWSQIRVRN